MPDPSSAAPEPTGPKPDPASDPANPVDDVIDLLRSGLSQGWSALDHGVDTAVGALIDRRIAAALADPPATASAQVVIDAFDPKRSFSSGVADRARNKVLSRAARSGRHLGRLAGRAPVGLVLRVAPAVYDTAAAVVREVDAVAGHVTAVVRDAGHRPDPEAVHRAVVQLLLGEHIDPDTEPEHARLVGTWLRRAGGNLSRLIPDGRKPDAGRVLDAVAAVDPARLAAH